MAIYSSKSARAFYDDEVNTVIPDDAVRISKELHSKIINGPENGKAIDWGSDGIPFLVDRPAPTIAELAVTERLWRDEQLMATDGVVIRHRDERDIGAETTLAVEQYSELLAYRQALRNWPQAEAFPDSLRQRPAEPGWLAQLTQ
ncbi:phage tail assembly chaperone [Pseudomonas sp. S07E 245]|uniref:phage tail assembly chaperone n=1 Tax=Pseudomonas sp. S07E 245 TaxID=2866278 RepID=UPI001C72A8D4|nr:phage tail assembly chaperone [Pseudomonas sp. S07E 245]QYX52999.1 phage tail assembly chaperone [Pseudomonas sp. S07E 245]